MNPPHSNQWGVIDWLNQQNGDQMNQLQSQQTVTVTHEIPSLLDLVVEQPVMPWNLHHMLNGLPLSDHEKSAAKWKAHAESIRKSAWRGLLKQFKAKYPYLDPEYSLENLDRYLSLKRQGICVVCGDPTCGIGPFSI